MNALAGGAGRWDTPLPFFSSSAPPAEQSAASSTSSTVLAVPEGRISDRERLALAPGLIRDRRSPMVVPRNRVRNDATRTEAPVQVTRRLSGRR